MSKFSWPNIRDVLNLSLQPGIQKRSKKGNGITTKKKSTTKSQSPFFSTEPSLPLSPPTIEKLSLDSPPIPWFKDSKVIPEEEEETEEKCFDEEEKWDNLSDTFDTSLFLADEASDDEDSLPKEDFVIMEKIPVTHWKHVIYNLLVENHNDPKNHHFCTPFHVKLAEKDNKFEGREGFRFDIKQNPPRKLAELWAFYEKGQKLEDTTLTPIFKDDLYKYYLRAALDLLAKYFIKLDKFTFLYDGTPLFIPNGRADEAIARLKTISSRNRKKNGTKPKTGRTKNPKSKKKRTLEDSFISTNSIKLESSSFFNPSSFNPSPM